MRKILITLLAILAISACQPDDPVDRKSDIEVQDCEAEVVDVPF